jgi:phosphoesterase RecJ-like protein
VLSAVETPESPASRLLGALRGASSILLTGPVEPDGDSIGACLAFAGVLRRLLPGIPVAIAGEPSYRYAWLEGADTMIPDGDVGAFDAVVVLDGDRHRLCPKATAAFESARIRGIIDHHASTKSDGYTHAWIDPAATSACEMVAEAMDAWGVPLDACLAGAVYVGMIFDTGGFRYSNTKPATHRLAARLLETGIDHAGITARILMERREAGLRLAARTFETATLALDGKVIFGRVSRQTAKELCAGSGDLEGIVESMLYVVGVEVAVLGIEKEGGTKISFRSRGAVDVQALAHGLVPTGGGHKKAAGAFVPWNLDEMERLVTAAIAEVPAFQ